MSDMDVALKELMLIDGAIGAAVVDYDSGMPLGTLGASKFLDLQIAAAGNTEVVRAEMRTIQQLGLNQQIEDLIITLSNQYHVIRPMTGHNSRGLFLYLALDRGRANLALARHRIKGIEGELQV